MIILIILLIVIAVFASSILFGAISLDRELNQKLEEMSKKSSREKRRRRKTHKGEYDRRRVKSITCYQNKR